MIRIRGFARKRRSTKGGSLSVSARDVSASNGHSDHQEHARTTMGNNGNGIEAIQRNGVGAVHRDGSDGPSATAGHIARIENHGEATLTNYLHDVVEQLVESPAAVEGRGPLNLLSVDGQVTPQFEERFAEAANSISGAKPIPWWKRVFDVVCITATLPIWLPLLLVVMVWIKTVSPGPIFYRQHRVGYRGRRFKIFKFRTMHANADTRTHEQYFAYLMNSNRPMTKLDAMDDNRLIRGGRVLRASGLDELPQLFNVLRGEMSLVGPRPCLPNEFMRYTPAQRRRTNALPGLTGYWQVNGKNKTTFSEMIAMDIFYSEHMSVALDLGIIAKTIPALVIETLESRGRRNGDGVMESVSPSGLNG